MAAPYILSSELGCQLLYPQSICQCAWTSPTSVCSVLLSLSLSSVVLWIIIHPFIHFIHLPFHAAHVIALFVLRLTHTHSSIWSPFIIQTWSVRRKHMYKYLTRFCSSSSGLSIVFRSLPLPLQPTLSALIRTRLPDRLSRLGSISSVYLLSSYLAFKHTSSARRKTPAFVKLLRYSSRDLPLNIRVHHCVAGRSVLGLVIIDKIFEVVSWVSGARVALTIVILAPESAVLYSLVPEHSAPTKSLDPESGVLLPIPLEV